MAQNQSTFPRWIPLLGGLLGSTTCGSLLYAFSVFIKPMMEQFGWSLSEMSLAYSLICLVFGVVGILAGFLNDRFGPRPVTLIGGLIMAFGFFMVSTITPPDQAALLAGDPAAKALSRKALYLFYLYYGVIAGFGGGLVYVPPIATAPKWWPDRRAVATGFAVVGMGLGSFVMAPLSTRMIAAYNGNALPVFKYVGIVMAVMVVITTACLKAPPPNFRPAGWTPPAPPKLENIRTDYRDYTHAETMRSPQFWMMWVAYFCGSFAGLMVIGLIAKHGIDAMSVAYRVQHGLEATAAIPEDVSKQIAMAAAWAPSILAIFNAGVRVAVGPLADKMGTRKLFLVLFSLQVVAMMLLFPAGKNPILLSACAGLIGWNYGSMMTLFPSTLMTYYGPSSQGSNYGVLFSSWGVAGFLGPYLGGKLQIMTGSFFVPFVASGVIVAMATVILFMLKPPPKKLAA